MRNDMFSNVGAALALAPAVQSAAIEGAAVDMQAFGSVVIAISTGAIVGAGDFGAKLQESDDGLAFTDVAADEVLSNVPATLAASSAYKLGYRGSKRYIRVALTKAGGTSIAAGAVAVKGNPAIAPVA